MEAGRGQRGLGQVVQTELQPRPGDGEAGEGPQDEAGLEDEAARHAAQHDASLGKARHEVEETRPAAEDGDEDDDEGGDPRHVLQLPGAAVVQGHQLTVVLQEQHAASYVRVRQGGKGRKRSHLRTSIATCHVRTMIENLTCLNLIFRRYSSRLCLTCSLLIS